MTTKTVLSIKKPTPLWATWIFRVVFLLTGVATGIIAADPHIGDEFKIRAGIYLKGLDTLIWGLTRIVGVHIDTPTVPTEDVTGIDTSKSD